jgi:hypothetical protein
MNATRTAWWVLGAVVLLAAAATGPGAMNAAAPPEQPKALPAEETVEPAIDSKKAAFNPILVVADARNRTASQNNLKEIALGFHIYASKHDSSLPNDVLGKDGKPLLSWRVVLLPHIGEKKLYEQFRLYEPWDSKHNLPLVEKMPKVYACPRAKLKNKGYTVYQVFAGPGAVYVKGRAPAYGIATIPDGTSNTILAVECSQAVPWTKPADIAYDRAKAVPDFGRAFGNKPSAALFDGSVRLLDLKTISSTTLKNAIDPADGNVLGPDF